MSDFLICSDWENINQVVDSSDYTEITFDKQVRGFTIFVDGGVKVFHKKYSTDTNYFVLMPFSTNPRPVVLLAPTPSLGFFKTEAGTATLRIHVGI